MIVVNAAFIEEFLIPMVGGEDREDDEEVMQMSKLNLDKREDRTELIHKFLLPAFRSRPEEIKRYAKDSLAYYLCSNKINFERVLDSIMAPVIYSDNVRLFFIQLWELAFTGESYEYIRRLAVREEFGVPQKLYEKKKNTGNLFLRWKNLFRKK
ncbi:hypothetical protein ACFOTA_16090 [Chitinophaga sp. GCM10012297]|uniref:Uncharacterized protein n=1 Tax=Chitinophaga chungangae TaxID=2821488 RepID=A0ABS3YGC4_9BACT|nr:hypothetical protein [Chitinophaga chungangae]MBO9153740.1 hypothetical protein [Chitinophaga chungangae]